MASPIKEIKVQIDSITIDRYNRLKKRGDMARIAERAPVTKKMILYYLKTGTAPISVATIIKEFYEEKETATQLLETPTK